MPREFIYVWQDAHGRLRAKTHFSQHEKAQNEYFDGSSTGQAPTENSDLLLVPVREYRIENQSFVLSEVCYLDGTPHETNHRAKLKQHVENAANNEVWVGWEPEFTLMGFDGRPHGSSAVTNNHYAGVGADEVQGRSLVNGAVHAAFNLGIKVNGINAEVGKSQHEVQIFSDDLLKAADDLIMFKYILYTLTEQMEDCWVTFQPKPFENANGNGLHVHFSTSDMRKHQQTVEKFAESFKVIYNEMDKSILGENNDKRMTGKHETAHLDNYSWGYSDRTATVRIPPAKDRVEFRAPAANANPYLVLGVLMENLK